jgi:hypothetical protein
VRVPPALLALLLLAGCGGAQRTPGRPLERAVGHAIPAQDLRPVPIGHGPRFQPAAGRYDARPAAGLPCGPVRAPRFGVHLELFAAGRVVVVPAGLGVVGGGRDGAFVRGGRCRHALSTTEPTGVIEVRHGAHATLGDLFALWGRPLSRTRLVGFRGPVRAWVDGRRWRADPRAIRLRRHAQIVLATGPEVPVHSAFAFRAGL